jgi:hypothetical protein
MVLYENMPYDIYKKLMSIENETFRDFLRMALAQNFEEYIKTRQKQ